MLKQAPLNNRLHPDLANFRAHFSSSRTSLFSAAGSGWIRGPKPKRKGFYAVVTWLSFRTRFNFFFRVGAFWSPVTISSTLGSTLRFRGTSPGVPGLGTHTTIIWNPGSPPVFVVMVSLWSTILTLTAKLLMISPIILSSLPPVLLELPPLLLGFVAVLYLRFLFARSL